MAELPRMNAKCLGTLPMISLVCCKLYGVLVLVSQPLSENAWVWILAAVQMLKPNPPSQRFKLKVLFGLCHCSLRLSRLADVLPNAQWRVRGWG